MTQETTYNADIIPERFTNPFRYFPHPKVVKIAEDIMERIDRNKELSAAFREGKMLGVLIARIPEQARDEEGPLCYLAAFSGAAGGESVIKGFVPPIFDLLDPDGHFKIQEAEISAISTKINSLETSSELMQLRTELEDAEIDKSSEILFMKARMAISKRERDEIRSEVSDQSRMDELIRESQFEKAELRRLKSSWDEKIGSIKEKILAIEHEIGQLKDRRARMSDELQDWIFRQYIVHNSLGEEASIHDIFAAEGLVPPGGTGDCAAPKLLEFAFKKGLKPVAMGEFWYGKSPATAVRTHGHFYPSCTSKCGPLLKWMLRGMDVEDGFRTSAGECGEDFGLWDGKEDGLKVIYEDEVLIAVDKPSGMPSVPGLDGRVSAFEILKRREERLHVVHRLDMDTSGILIFAKTAETAVEIQKQFENHTVKKTYHARLSAGETDCWYPYWFWAGRYSDTFGYMDQEELKEGDKGVINLPLSPDYDERPRQKVDFKQGKAAATEYEVVSANEDGTLDIMFRPHTGRTHQLRVHAAHTLGLARPILGDPLYGGAPASRLYLHAAEITFLHPSNGKVLTIK